ncbi:hypothetical protein [Cupriavidus alkaliphilus]|uniref:hypothetical protein n=1 Tax=Cupriavidus alkaliphilus TaxID=942866 RepID=UPI00160A57E5|nr:hypothetical protein [Cupriavidus alkaliphilus]MBB2918312.1 hypothetical protein [Cupriavidus alkaliphilus]
MQYLDEAGYPFERRWAVRILNRCIAGEAVPSCAAKMACIGIRDDRVTAAVRQLLQARGEARWREQEARRQRRQ